MAWVPCRLRSTIIHKKQPKQKPGQAPPTAGPGFRHRLLGAQPRERQVGQAGGAGAGVGAVAGAGLLVLVVLVLEMIKQVGEGRALLEEEEELVGETVGKINNSLHQGAGRLFAVVGGVLWWWSSGVVVECCDGGVVVWWWSSGMVMWWCCGCGEKNIILKCRCISVGISTR